MAFRDSAKRILHGTFHPIVRLFIYLGITPNIVTTIGLILNICVAIIFIIGAEYGDRGDLSYVGWGGACILFAGMFDMIDGQVARLGKSSSRFGALYDSVLDRYSELFMFLGICYYLVSHHYFLSSLVAFIALIGSVMVSYTRARAEGLGIPCTEGLMQRPERVILIGVSAIVCGIVAAFTGGLRKWTFESIPGFYLETISFFTFPMIAVALLANYTAGQRLFACYRYLKEKGEE
ncbi:MAG: CDP-alcohol phosphatidyltransferase family protein [Bacteroidia bacterium]|nr:CDP-alcohol phosphatidyltransferase family protein [Bacteroidia bacterium]